MSAKHATFDTVGTYKLTEGCPCTLFSVPCLRMFKGSPKEKNIRIFQRRANSDFILGIVYIRLQNIILVVPCSRELSLHPPYVKRPSGDIPASLNGPVVDRKSGDRQTV